MDRLSRMEIIAANVNEHLSVNLLRNLTFGSRSAVGDWILEGDEWIIYKGEKTLISECFFNDKVEAYTRAPQTITTKSVEIPKPISVLPDEGVVYVSDPISTDLYYVNGVAHRPDSFSNALKRGRLHLTAEAAIAHSKADIESAGGVWE